MDHEITQIREEEEADHHSSRVSSSAHSTHSTFNSHSTVPAPASPVQQTANVSAPAAVQAHFVSSTTSAGESNDVGVLKRELESAHQTIQSLQSTMDKLQREASTVRLGTPLFRFCVDRNIFHAYQFPPSKRKKLLPSALCGCALIVLKIASSAQA